MPIATADTVFPLDGEDIQHVSHEQLVQTAKAAPTVYVGGGARIARVHTSAVLKYGREVRLSEAETMQYVADKTTVRLPQMIQAWEEEDEVDDRSKGYILMSYVEGRVLSELWPDMDEEAQRKVRLQIVEVIQQLHSTAVDSPGPIGVDVCNGAVFTNYGAGPFKSIDGLKAWFNERLSVCNQFGRLEMPPFSSSDFQPLVLCHMDLFPRNMILDPTGKIWLLDWGYAGGYPAHFEQAVLRGRDKGFTDGLLDALGKSDNDQVQRLQSLPFGLTTAAVTRPAGYPG